MNKDRDFFELDPDRYSREDLVTAAQGAESIAGVTPELAVSLLRRKGPDAVDDLARLLDDDELPDRVRWTAAVELGRLGSASATEALQRAEHERPDLVQRGAVQALRQLQAVTRHQEMLETFRQRGDLSVPFPERLIRDLAGADVRLHVGDVEASAVERAAREVSAAVGAELDPRRAVTVECAGTSLAYLPLAGVELDPDQLLERPALLGHVAVHRTAEVERWARLYDVLTQPGTEHGTVQVIVTTDVGTPVYAGVLRSGEDEAMAFEVSAVEGAGVGPTRVTGNIVERGVRIEDAVSGAAPDRLPVHPLN